MIEFGKFRDFREHGFSNSVKKLVFRTFFSNANNSQFVNMLLRDASRSLFQYFSPLFYAVGEVRPGFI